MEGRIAGLGEQDGHQRHGHGAAPERGAAAPGFAENQRGDAAAEAMEIGHGKEAARQRFRWAAATLAAALAGCGEMRRFRQA